MKEKQLILMMSNGEVRKLENIIVGMQATINKLSE